MSIKYLTLSLLLCVFQLVYPQDVKLTEKEVSSECSNAFWWMELVSVDHTGILIPSPDSVTC